ncbi:deoxycytidyl transferase [Mycoblastus sanguinarius]|nr:deoxycytidyl transferase [Mycoblastus sanguinarius]
MGSRLESTSSAVRKRIEKHKFENEEGEEYESSKFGGFSDYFRRKKIKLQNLDAERRSSSTNNPPIFRGVVAHVNGYTQPSLNDLHNLIVKYGGGFMQYLDGKTTVTHIVASNLTPKKKVEFSRYRIVKPAWVVDSIKAGKLLPWDAYRVVDEGIGQRVLGFENGSVISQANNVYGGYKDQTEASWYTEQVKGVADELNSRDPKLPYQSTQDDDIKDENGEAYFGTDYDREDTKGRIQSLDTHGGSQLEGREQEEVEAWALDVDREQNDDRLGGALMSARLLETEQNLDLDADILPAVDESFTDSQVDAGQEQTAKQSVVQIEEIAGGANRGKLQLSAVSRIEGNESPSASQPAPGSEREEDPAPQSYSSATSVPRALVSEEAFSLTGFDPSLESELQGPGTEQVSALEARHPESGSASRDSILKRRTSSTELTAEEHNAQLLADPRVWKSTVVNPGFLQQYYEESRLHHLSAWKADLKSQLQAMAAEKSSSQRSREKRPLGARRYILHVDFDSFFAAVSLKKFPQYIDRPVVIAHGGGSGSEIASCNYPARKFGIKNGMWMKHAQKMCTDLKVLPYDFPEYEAASRKFYEAIMDTGGIVQSVSIDEALIDVSTACIAAGGHDGKGIHEGSIWREQEKADKIASNLRDIIKEKTGCAVSVGVGGNILLAKVALRKAKPAGQYHVKPEEALEFLGNLTVQELPGVAWSIGGKLEEIGVRYVKDVRELSKERMISVLGPKTGEKIWDYSRGIDKVEVGEQVVRKSVSAEVNWGIRFVTQQQADEFVQCLCEEVHKRLINEGVKGRQLMMKIMRRAADAPLDPPKHLGHGKCDTFNKSIILGCATNDKDVMGREAISIMHGFGFSPGELRGLGVQITKLESLRSGSLQDSSQKRLQFKASTPPKTSLPREDSIVDDIESPQKPKVRPPPHPAAAFAKDTSPSGKPRTPLNTLGTQFVLPTQVDPEVLAELPTDIRSKLLPRQTEINPKPNQPREETPIARSRSSTPSAPDDAVPSHSQIDPETLDALPTDLREEILSFYAKAPNKAHNQALLPQSPRKARSIKLPKKLATPTKKRTGLLSRSGNKQTTSVFSTLTQSNFVANARASTSALKPAAEGPPADIPDDFLSALPEDIRREVLAQARRDRLQKKGGIDLTSSKKKRPPPKNTRHPQGQRILQLPPRPPKPTFTAHKYSSLPELREAISAWFDEFREEGPYKEDVDALVKYLGKVVIEERDLDKAVSVGKWLGWVIDEGGNGAVWGEAISEVKDGVQDAVKERGLGRVDF